MCVVGGKGTSLSMRFMHVFVLHTAVTDSGKRLVNRRNWSLEEMLYVLSYAQENHSVYLAKKKTERHRSFGSVRVTQWVTLVPK